MEERNKTWPYAAGVWWYLSSQLLDERSKRSLGAEDMKEPYWKGVIAESRRLDDCKKSVTFFLSQWRDWDV